MILAIDAGNTRAKWKVWRDDHAYASGVFDYAHSELALKKLLQDYAITRIFLAEVGSAGLALLLPVLCADVAVTVCQSQKRLLSVSSSYQQSARLGVDRFFGFVEAYHLEGKKAVAVLDIGTAATFDVVDSQGQHLGGHIVPGLSLLQTALQLQTDKVDFEHSLNLHSYWGQSTQQAVEQGTAAMLLAWVESQLARFWQRFPGANVYLTGGLAQGLVDVLPTKNVILHQDLVLDAMKRLADDEN